MTEDELRRRLANSPPPLASTSARDLSVQEAMVAFDAAASDRERQGSKAEVRQRSRQSGLIHLWRRLMSASNPSYRSLLLGGSSLAVLSVALFVGYGSLQQSAQIRTLELPGGDTGTVEPVSEERIAATAERDAAQPLVTAEPVIAEQAEVTQPRQERRMAPGTTVPHGAAGQPSAAPRTAQPSGGLAASPEPSIEAPVQMDRPAPTDQIEGRDTFDRIETNPVRVTAQDPVSTFSVDVDTASYAFIRRQILGGVLPQKDAVRIEEMINYFPYGYAPPTDDEMPFETHVSVFETPWNSETQLMRIAIKGYELQPATRPRANLVFLLDTSGSMNAPDKLPLLINSFRMLVDTLSPQDTVSIVVYAGSAGTVLEPTSVSQKGKIFAALERLRAGGATAGGEGIRQAYALAEQNFDPDGVNRVILATDGDFNVGITSTEELEGFVERKRETGIYLSVLGFGQGNLNDRLMQALAQNGNGHAAYIDTLSEARKTLVEEATSSLFPIAQDVKIQVEFNPAAIAEYRLIGYETRLLEREDFKNDRVDAGEIGAGHTVTALYEIVPTGGKTLIDPLRYGDQASQTLQNANEFAFLKLRYKHPGQPNSQVITRPITAADQKEPDIDARFAAAVAGFGQLLRGGQYTGDWGYDALIELASSAKGTDPFGYRAEFVNLVRLAQTAAALPR